MNFLTLILFLLNAHQAADRPSSTPFFDMSTNDFVAASQRRIAASVEYKREGRDLFAQVRLTNLTDKSVTVPRLTPLTCLFSFSLFDEANKEVQPTTSDNRGNFPFIAKYDSSMVVSLPPAQTLFQQFKFPHFYPNLKGFHGSASLNIYFAYPLVKGKDSYVFELAGPKKALPWKVHEVSRGREPE